MFVIHVVFFWTAVRRGTTVRAQFTLLLLPPLMLLLLATIAQEISASSLLPLGPPEVETLLENIATRIVR